MLVLAPELYAPLRQLGAQFHASADGLAVAERMLDLLEAPARPSSHGRRGSAEPCARRRPARGRLVRLPGRPGTVLDGLDLELEPGETVALVGPSGAGKSTVASLLLRLPSPSEGRVAVGGVDLARCDARAWRRQLAWVPQRPTLLRGTVAENIRLGDPRRSRRPRSGKRPRSPAPTSSCARCRSGYDTLVGDGGRPLSAGRGASGSRWRGRSCATRRSSSSTSRPRTSIRRAPRSSRTRSSGCARTAPCLLIVAPPRARRAVPTASSGSTAGGSWNRVRGGGRLSDRPAPPARARRESPARRVAVSVCSGDADGRLRRRADGLRRVSDLARRRAARRSSR